MSRKLQAARRAIDDLFGDTSVSQEATLEAMQELQADIDGKIYALKGDIDAQGGPHA